MEIELRYQNYDWKGIHKEGDTNTHARIQIDNIYNGYQISFMNEMKWNGKIQRGNWTKYTHKYIRH